MSKGIDIAEKQGAIREIKTNKILSCKVLGKVEDYSDKSYLVIIKLKFGEKVEEHNLFIAKSKIQTRKESFYCPIWIINNNKNVINCEEIIQI